MQKQEFWTLNKWMSTTEKIEKYGKEIEFLRSVIEKYQSIENEDTRNIMIKSIEDTIRDIEHKSEIVVPGWEPVVRNENYRVFLNFVESEIEKDPSPKYKIFFNNQYGSFYKAGVSRSVLKKSFSPKPCDDIVFERWEQ